MLETPSEIPELLAKIPEDASISSSPDLLRAGGAGDQLWRQLRSMPGDVRFGKVTTSKLLAAKRPGLFPIKDRVVVSALTGQSLDRVNNWWDLWAERYSHPGASALSDAAAAIGSTIDRGFAVSALRVLDVVIWMRRYGWTQAGPEGRDELADFSLPLEVG